MNLTRAWSLLLLGGLLFSACAGSKNKVNYKKPESVAVAFVRSLAVLDIESANKVATEDTKSVLTLLETMKGVMSEEELNEMKAESEEQLKYIKKATCIKDGDTAKCTVCCNEAGKENEKPLTLKKVNNKWLVHMSKEDLMDGKEN